MTLPWLAQIDAAQGPPEIVARPKPGAGRAGARVTCATTNALMSIPCRCPSVDDSVIGAAHARVTTCRPYSRVVMRPGLFPEVAQHRRLSMQSLGSSLSTAVARSSAGRLGAFVLRLLRREERPAQRAGSRAKGGLLVGSAEGCCRAAPIRLLQAGRPGDKVRSVAIPKIQRNKYMLGSGSRAPETAILKPRPFPVGRSRTASCAVNERDTLALCSCF